MIKYTDKPAGNGIWMSLSAIYTHGEKAQSIRHVVEQAMPEFRKILSLPNGLQFRIAPIKARHTNGTYMVEDNLVSIDCRLTWGKALEVLAHELVHAEQYHTGKLKKAYIKRKGWTQSWNGEVGSKGTTYKAYRDQPWEQEAWSRQAELAERVCQALELKHG